MKLHTLLPILPALLLAACSDNHHSDKPDFTEAAVIATRTSGFDAGAVSLVDVDAPYTARNNLAPSDSDIFVKSGGDHYFVLKRFMTNQIARFEAGSPATPTYTYSTQSAEEVESNPSDLLIVSDTKAYLLRYGSGKLWIVNPSAATEAGFKTGEIDLSAYDSDGVPEMTGGLIKDGKLYVAMQRLEFFDAVKSSYVAVIDTSNDQEIDTNPSASGLKGIELPVRNVSGLVSVPNSNRILVIAAGGFGTFPSFITQYDGGIVSINPNGYIATLLLDDGSIAAHPFGQFTDLAVADDDRAYFIGSTGFSANQTLYRFNPDSATPTPVAVAGFGPLALGSLAVDPSGKLWVGRNGAAAPGITVLGFENGAETVEKDLIDTNLIPINIDFVTVPALAI